MATNIPGIQGLRGTGQFGTDLRPTNYRELYTLIEPNGTAPLNALLSMMGSEETDDPRYTNFRDELPDRRLKIDAGAGYNASATGLTVDATNEVTFVVAGSILVNARTGEVMRATTNATGTTVTVQRNIGGTAYTVLDNDEIFVAGFAAAEGDVSPQGVSFDPTTAYNFTQIFRTAYMLTNTAKATTFRTGPREDEYATKALKLHMSDIERAMFWGRRHEDMTSPAQPVRYTGGLINSINTVVDAATFTTPGKMTEDEFDRLLVETIFAYGGKEKLAFVGPRVAGHLQAIGKKRWSPTTVDGTYGVSITGYKTFAGTLMVHMHPQFRQVPGMDNTMIILDTASLKYRYLKGRDTNLLKDRQARDVDAVKHEYLTECGLELLQDKTNAIIKGWQTVEVAA